MDKYKRDRLESVYKAHVFEVYDDYLTLPDGRSVVYDLIKHRPGACVLPVLPDGRVILVAQYRNSIDDISYEAPAGFIDDGESPEDAARRELREETGYIAGEMCFVARTVLAIGTSDEQTYVYISRDLSKGESHPDENEFMEVCCLTMEQIHAMIENGQIVDSKTLIALYACMNGKTR